jgi:hypothetical protein
MPLVDDTDINIHLPLDKIQAESVDNLDEIKDDAERVIRGILAGHVDPVEMALWTAPDTTPGVIRAIGGRLCAAFIYRLRYSEDSLDDPQYAQFKYDEAMRLLTGIVNGDVSIEDDPSTVNLNTDMFYPNDANTDPPKFSMSSVF